MSPSPLIAGEDVAAVSALLWELGLPVTLLSPLLAHADAVEAEADRLGLISAADRGHVLSRHTADSLLFALAHAPQPGETWVDVGSGAGFPGMVLGICYAETSFQLVEPQQRRAGFLDLQVTRLGLANVDVRAARASDISPGFDVATARALAEPLLALELLRRLASAGVSMVAVGSEAVAPSGVTDMDVRRAGVDSPGRIFMIAESAGTA
ncbi:MAG: RsmG family class I SAM-dependent methyltransferase [Actinomycetota bacterium]